jgi:predicted nucleic acid-binding protein
MIDSSLLIEYIKGDKIQLLSDLLGDDGNECCINETVISEYLFHLLKVTSNISPQSVQSSNRIKEGLDQSGTYGLLQRFSFLSTKEDMIFLVPQYMKEYNLLPNDAIILATCKMHSITRLASHDTDFNISCEEGIELLIEKE